ncbi:MAG: hypothetical protein LBO76_07715 [Treponema sp.]|jgi:hypothetical protein|nr:hypothetical protein [Treponema sp.]
MKNKLVLAALAAALLCGLAFTACKNDVLDVKVVYDKANTVSNLKAVKNGTDIIVTWDAADDAGGYVVYSKKDGTKQVSNISHGGGGSPTVENGKIYKDDGSLDASAKYNPDKYSFVYPIPSPLPSGAEGDYLIGVQTYPLSEGGNVAPSDIVWSPAVAIE